MNNDVKYWYKDDPQGADTSNYLIHKNDILINFINSESKMGTATIVDTEPDRDTIYTTNILKMKVDNTVSDSLFLLYLTMTYHYCNYIKSITKPAVNQASFTTVDYKNYSFMMPLLEEQKKIGIYLNKIDHLITLHQHKLFPVCYKVLYLHSPKFSLKSYCSTLYQPFALPVPSPSHEVHGKLSLKNLPESSSQPLNSVYYKTIDNTHKTLQSNQA